MGDCVVESWRGKRRHGNGEWWFGTRAVLVVFVFVEHLLWFYGRWLRLPLRRRNCHCCCFRMRGWTKTLHWRWCLSYRVDATIRSPEKEASVVPKERLDPPKHPTKTFNLLCKYVGKTSNYFPPPNYLVYWDGKIERNENDRWTARWCCVSTVHGPRNNITVGAPTEGRRKGQTDPKKKIAKRHLAYILCW